MNKFNFWNFVHWLSIGSGAVTAGAAYFTNDPKLGTAAVAVVSIAQMVHKVVDSIDVTPAAK